MDSMTQTQIDQLKVGDVLKISEPKSPAAKAQRTKIISIFEPALGVRVAKCKYYQVINGRAYYDAPNNGNGCELNENLFGDEEVVLDGEL